MKNILLVNRDNKFNEKYLNYINLVSVKSIYDTNVLVEENTYKAFLKLKDYLFENNIVIGIDNAYRSVEEQENLFQKYEEKYGIAYRDNYVAIPGYSEHHTGSAIDFSLFINNKWLSEDEMLLLDDSIMKFVHNSLSKFGFILRYPKIKENVTGYNYESWHIRYVGVVPATIIINDNLTLEEYLRDFSGVIALNKKSGPTSRDYVNEISKIFGLKKVGHTGTLDPLAEGVLLITIGKATKIAELLTSNYKEYIAEVTMGIKTDTYDIEGNIIEKSDILGNINLNEALEHFKTTYFQEVPIYSAIKVNGKKLYEYARNNEKVELPKKEVTIKEIKLLGRTDNKFTFKALVSKGCYIRSLINDVGKYLNIPMTMSKLIRTQQGNVSIDETYCLDDIKSNKFKLLSIDECLNYPVIILENNLLFKVVNGAPIDNTWQIKDKVIFKNKNSKILGIYQVKDKKLISWKNF